MLRLVKKWLNAKKTEFELQCLDDRMLKDIGISRGDIKWIARHQKR